MVARGLLAATGIYMGDKLMAMPQTQVFQYYEKSNWTWGERLGVTTPDITGPMIMPRSWNTYTSSAGTFLVAADSVLPSVNIGIVFVLWDNRGNPLSVIPREIYTSGWAKNAAGNYISQSGGDGPGFAVIDVSLAAGVTYLVQSIMPKSTVNFHWKLF